MGRFAGAAAKFVGRKYPTADGGSGGPKKFNKIPPLKLKKMKPYTIKRPPGDGQNLNRPNSYGGNRHA